MDPCHNHDTDPEMDPCYYHDKDGDMDPCYNQDKDPDPSLYIESGSASQKHKRGSLYCSGNSII